MEPPQASATAVADDLPAPFSVHGDQTNSGVLG